MSQLESYMIEQDEKMTYMLQLLERLPSLQQAPPPPSSSSAPPPFDPYVPAAATLQSNMPPVVSTQYEYRAGAPYIEIQDLASRRHQSNL